MTGFPTELHRLYNEDKDLFHEQFYALVLSLSAMIAPRYPPKTYNNNQRWSEEEYRALAQDVYIKQLLPPNTGASATNQIDWIMTHAKTDEAIRGLIGRHIKITLNDRRDRTVVDNLIARIRELSKRGKLSMQELPGGRYYSLPTIGTTAPVQLTESDLNQAANKVRELPIIWRQPDAKRESAAYPPEVLMKVMEIVLSITKCISETDLRRILEKVLTALLPVHIETSEGKEEAVSKDVNQILLVEIEESIQVFVKGLRKEELVVLWAHTQGIKDEVVGELIGKVRQTVIDYRSKIVDKLQILLKSMSPSDTPEVVIARLIEVVRARLEELGLLQGIDEIGSLS